ncbi:right-handed parallel beta-helix repeat-containing protein [Aquisphaera insulae]|uniref:right-handed parallel beta-helix repeat-containing protein n=1 Tax=Aquisphaera insulae TaxID=2712864 RepID=UPI0013EE30C1|nr:right-handed parallel beta-helix repeat-containing protein [Aquisphaera insulae]
MKRIALVLLVLASSARVRARDEPTRTVSDVPHLRDALARARPGESILLAPGEYRGDVMVQGLHGEPGKPIVLRASDPKRPPVFRDGTTGLHLSRVAHVELRDLIVIGATGNGVNIDDGGTLDRPSHHVLVRNLVIRDIGPTGNRDGLKLSGVDDFRVEGCTIERWGSGGSGIDMVGCHRGEIVGSTFRHGDTTGDSGVQAKGGSRDIVIRRCRFEHAGQRAVNLGGSTGLAFFRPRLEGHEAKEITVEDCTFDGSMTPVAFVGVDGASVRHNTIYRPRRWGFRILQENRAPGFVPCRNGQFTDNLIAFRSDEMVVPANIGDATAPQSFTLTRNAWYCLDASGRSRPSLPIPEKDGTYGIDPGFRDAEAGDLRLRPDSPLRAVGAREGDRR